MMNRSSTGFPLFTQVMSPTNATAQNGAPHEGTRVDDAQLASQIRALVGTTESTQPPATRKRKEGDGSPRTSIDARPAADQLQAGSSGAATGAAITLRPLNVGKPESYENWRKGAQAAVACRAGVDQVAMDYLAEIDNPQRPNEELVAAVKQVPALRVLDMHLYLAILDCIDGDRRDTVLDRVHARAKLGEGCVALRCLDSIFQRSSTKQRAAATAEILHLTPRGSGATAMDDFLARFRTLLSRAGTGVGPAVQADILQRAAAGHPVLGPVAAAWKHGDGEDAQLLLERLEAAVAEGMYASKGGGHIRAWAVQDRTPMQELEDELEPDRGAAMAAAQRTAPERTGGPECWSCGKRGHRQYECQKGGKKTEKGKGKGKNSDETMTMRMDRVERMLERISSQLASKNA